MKTIVNLCDSDRRPTAFRRIGKKVALLGLLSGAVCFPGTAKADDLSDMKQALKQLQEQNQTLMRRIAALEAEQSAQRQARQRPAQPAPAQAPTAVTPSQTPPSQTPPSQTANQAGTAPPAPASNEELDRRVRDLEMTKAAQEDATRSIIRTAVAKTGPRINEFLSLSGAIEVIAGRAQDFSGAVSNNIFLNTAELDFDIRAANGSSAASFLGSIPARTRSFPPVRRVPPRPASESNELRSIAPL